MRGHEWRWCTYEITYERPNGSVWNKKWKKQVQNDGQINTFKATCLAIFQGANPGIGLENTHVRSVFTDGKNTEPTDAKLVA